jgi:Formyl transferase
MVEPARPPSSARRLVYLGTPEAAVAPLRALVDAGFEIALVVSRPDRRRGRGGALSPSPVKAAATELGLTVTDVLDDVLGVDADLGVVVAYGRIIPSRILERLPMINLHFSLLPRWRGAAPVERALLAGDIETGVCVMDVDVEPDFSSTRCGPVSVDRHRSRARSPTPPRSIRPNCASSGRPRPPTSIGWCASAVRIPRSAVPASRSMR